MPSIQKGKYKHYKGHFYEVMGLVRHSEDESYLVLYRPLYVQKDGQQDWWVRPYSMFVESVEVDNVQIPRFELVEE